MPRLRWRKRLRPSRTANNAVMKSAGINEPFIPADFFIGKIALNNRGHLKTDVL